MFTSSSSFLGKQRTGTRPHGGWRDCITNADPVDFVASTSSAPSPIHARKPTDDERRAALRAAAAWITGIDPFASATQDPKLKALPDDVARAFDYRDRQLYNMVLCYGGQTSKLEGGEASDDFRLPSTLPDPDRSVTRKRKDGLPRVHDLRFKPSSKPAKNRRHRALHKTLRRRGLNILGHLEACGNEFPFLIPFITSLLVSE
ncbi:hypothetical protein V8E36_004359 [Tilletia maclaganii]